MRSRLWVFGIFIFWAVVTPVALLIFAFCREPILGDPHNPAARLLPRGSILDRNSVVLAMTAPDGSRRYPLGAAGSITGYVDRLAGIGGGLERNYGDSLIAKRTNRFWYFSRAGEPGDSLRTTLDARLLSACDEALGERKGAVVVMKLNGELLSVVSHPSFDPNKVGKEWQSLKNAKDSRLFNKAVQGFYPPGSVWKIISSMELLDREDRSFMCQGGIKIGDKLFRCPHPHGRVLGLADAFARSCNSYFISRGMREIKNRDFVAASKGFTTGMHEDRTGTNYALALIGQGPVLLSPMEAAVLAATIASGGKKPQPVYLKKEVTLNEVMPVKKARRIQSLMTGVVLRGTGRGMMSLVRQGRVLGLKTGTAEAEISGGRKTNIAWVVGFAGKKAVPEIAFALVVEDTDLYAAEVCLPLLRGILDTYLSSGKVAGA